MPNIFVSYSRDSKDIAAAVADDIKELGHVVWFDHELSGGQAWWNEILATVRRSDVFVFILTPQALSSIACTREYGYAAALRKPILPVLVAEDVSTNLLPPALAQIHYVDYRSLDRAAGFRLARALASLPPTGPLPDPLPASPEVPTSYLGSLNEQIESSSSLSYEQQSALLVDLRKGLRDPETAEDSRALLKRLRRRRDLLATIAEEIDELLASGKTAPAAQPKPWPAVRSPTQTPPPSPGEGIRPPEREPPNPDPTPTPPIGIRQSLTLRENDGCDLGSRPGNRRRADRNVDLYQRVHHLGVSHGSGRSRCRIAQRKAASAHRRSVGGRCCRMVGSFHIRIQRQRCLRGWRGFRRSERSRSWSDRRHVPLESAAWCSIRQSTGGAVGHRHERTHIAGRLRRLRELSQR